ncbi:MAG: response regulator transcription factor [Bdellovibrionaceae bacterium]|nr:response regulator transcription factor [Pseudobdellovibrionaceae bacterium]
MQPTLQKTLSSPTRAAISDTVVNLDPNILVVEDETEIRELIALHLLRQGFKVTECDNVSDAIDELGKKKFDVILLDWMLPGLSGMDLLGFLKDKEIDTRVVMVTAKTDPADIVQGLESGADDYLTKPFDPTILMARVRAVMRRVPKKESTEAQDEMNIGPLYINFRTYDVMLNNEKLHLTPSEFKLLGIMIQNQGRVLTRDNLIENIQGEGVNVIGRTIDTHVFGLRKKLGSWGDRIETIRGVGYRVKTESN